MRRWEALQGRLPRGNPHQPWAFPVMALSAWVEVTGLTIWAVDLWRSMNRAPQSRAVSEQVAIDAQTKVADVIDRYPETQPVFLRFGFTMIDNPVARRVFARSISLEQACRLKHVDCTEFLEALQSSIPVPSGSNVLVHISTGAVRR